MGGDESILGDEQKLSAMIAQLQKLKEQISNNGTPGNNATTKGPTTSPGSGKVREEEASCFL